MLKQKTVYFREEDLPLWAAIPNKAEWLHNALRLDFDKEILASYPPLIVKGTFSTPRKVLEKLPKYVDSICKIHGTFLDSRGKCLQKNCKYS